MPLFDDYITETELASELREKTGKGSRRTLRKWRTQQTGPAWSYLGAKVIYSIEGVKNWLREQERQPGRA